MDFQPSPAIPLVQRLVRILNTLGLLGVGTAITIIIAITIRLGTGCSVCELGS
jgi:hypothetical protein